MIPLRLPTLAEHKEDIPALVEHFVGLHGRGQAFSLSPACFEGLMTYHWPGNVRELENVVERMLALPDVAVDALFDEPLRRMDPLRDDREPAEIPAYRDYMQQCEDHLLRLALSRADGNISVASRMLGLPRSTLRSKLEKS